jgi:ADP-ribose pyrophosphatase
MTKNTVREYTDPEVLTRGVREGWADKETDPEKINWKRRKAQAEIAFQVVAGRPVNPCQRTGVRYGRNGLGLWGENLMADAIVTAVHRGVRYLLMVERGDGAGWALPGGSVEPGESGLQAALRELEEETGLAVPSRLPKADTPVYVPDPRASDEAWAVTLPVHIRLGHPDRLPAVTGGDDARRAQWVCAGSYEEMTQAPAAMCGGRVFQAHVALLQRVLG